MLDEPTLQRILDAQPGLSIAVVGDLFLDKYLDLDQRLTEISVETGLEAYQIVRVRCYPGAGGTVLNNLQALGVGRLLAVSVIGDDGEGYELLRALRERNIDTAGVIAAADRMTPTYTKPMLSPMSGPARELNRLDIKNRRPHSPEVDRQVMDALDRIVPQVDAVIVADQVTERNHGTITDAVRDHLAELARRHPQCRMLADSRSHIAHFRNLIAKPNRNELFAAVVSTPVGDQVADRAQVAAAARRLAERTGRPVFATLGSEGIMYVDAQIAEHVPGIEVSGPIDIVGAGDSTMAGIAAALCAGGTPQQAARVGCLVASITIQQLGVTGTATPNQVLSRWREASGTRTDTGN
ncbi:MAG: bifunctional heptose 7-phosphate kinase/heptose 1-phosphate adenyltransferase [Planctomycetales bacterium]